jgi:hypothetical protein
MATTKVRARAKTKKSAVKATGIGRIFFEGNPWPEGHAIEAFEWTATLVGGRVHFAFHLESARYYAERSIENEADSDWLSSAVWGNYHRCTLSATKWHKGSFEACKLEDYAAEKIDGLALRVDTVKGDVAEDRDGYAFHIYLLGHDAAANHEIKFSRVKGGDRFDIDWRGSIALAYAGRLKPEYRFRAQVLNVRMPKPL